MQVKTFTTGFFATNCHLVNCEETREALVIDPGFDSQTEAECIMKNIENDRLEPKLIINTHGHPDHTCGNRIIKDAFQIPILIHEKDAQLIGPLGKSMAEMFGFRSYSPPHDKLICEGDCVNLGKTRLKVIHTPGHTGGSISLLSKNEVFTGDTLFAGSIGRTDFPEGSDTDMNRSLKKLKTLSDNLIVYPGHGPNTTVGIEKHINPFLRALP